MKLKKIVVTVMFIFFAFTLAYGVDFDAALKRSTTSVNFGDFADSAKCSLYLKLDVLTSSLGLTRWQAVKLQKNFANLVIKNENLKEFTCDAPERLDYFKKSYELVISGVKPEGFPQIKKASEKSFVVVFDLDNTLFLETKKKENANCDIHFRDSKDYGRCINFSPFDRAKKQNSNQIILELKKMKNCLGIIFYTAKEDQLTDEILDNWLINGKKVESFLMGYLSKYDLVKNFNPPGYLPQEIKIFLKKDLSLISTDTDKLLIIDDNPMRLFQWENTREITPFMKPGDTSYPEVLKTVLEEIKETDSYVSDNSNKKTTFLHGFFPYTKLGRMISEKIKSFKCIADNKMMNFLREKRDLLLELSKNGTETLNKEQVCKQAI